MGQLVYNISGGKMKALKDINGKLITPKQKILVDFINNEWYYYRHSRYSLKPIIYYPLLVSGNGNRFIVSVPTCYKIRNWLHLIR